MNEKNYRHMKRKRGKGKGQQKKKRKGKRENAKSVEGCERRRKDESDKKKASK
jgi:hypothetical protein